MPFEYLRTAVREGLASAGIFGWMIRQRRFDGVVVLCYHSIRPDDQPSGAVPFEGLHVRKSVFASHCEALVRYCHPISLARWRSALAGLDTLPPRSVLVTFDDGYRSLWTEALPVLEQFRVPAAVFVCSDPVARGELFWHDAVAYGRGEDAVAAYKRMPYAEWRRAIEGVRQRVAVSAPAAPLTPDEVARLARHELIEIGGHTHRHAILARGDAEDQHAEIAENLHALASWTGCPPRAFAYPNGRAGEDFSHVTERLVVAAGIDQAFSTEEAIASTASSPAARPRFTITAGLTASRLQYRLAKEWQ